MLDVSGMGGDYDPVEGGKLSGQERSAQKERAKLVVRDMFNRYLGREPEREASEYYAEQILKGNSIRVSARNFDRVVREIMNSPEGQAYAAAVEAGTANIPDRTMPGGNYTYTDIDAWMAGDPASKLPDLDPTPDEEGYYSAANARDVDPFLWSKRGSFSGYKVKADSKAEIPVSDFASTLAGQTGRYGGRMILDPETGEIYEGITDNMSQAERDAFTARLEDLRSKNSLPMGVDPSLLTDVEKVRAKSLYGGLGRTDYRIGNTHYFVDDEGNIVSYQIKAIEYGYTPQFLGMNEGGTVPLRTSMGETEVTAGGIANVPTEFTASMPSEQEFSMVAAAVLGRIENPDPIIDMFVKKYGPEMFQRVRDFVLQNVAPNAQTEGMIRGQGSGMDDKVPGMIGDQQPVAVSPGEFIVPADVVSGLGDGSSDAGAEKLDQMMDRVRMARGGNTKQAPSIDADRMMPA